MWRKSEKSIFEAVQQRKEDIWIIIMTKYQKLLLAYFTDDFEQPYGHLFV